MTPAMNIGFLEAGTVTRTFGRHLVGAGHRIVVSNSRGPDTLTDFVAELGPNATAGTKHQAAACDIVILATWHASHPRHHRQNCWPRLQNRQDAPAPHPDPAAPSRRKRRSRSGRSSVATAS